MLAQGVAHVRRSVPALLEDAANGLPAMTREIFAELHERLRDLDHRLDEYDRRIAKLAREMPEASRLMQVEGVGPVIVSALIASVGDARLFANGRQMAAWLGRVPRQYSSGGKNRLGRITKRGDVYLRTLLIYGAADIGTTNGPQKPVGPCGERTPGLQQSHRRTGAAKHARILWALLARGACYQPTAAVSSA